MVSNLYGKQEFQIKYVLCISFDDLAFYIDEIYKIEGVENGKEMV